MDKVLGIDLGTNSIGWAIRDLAEAENQIIDKGVLTFDKGVAEVKGVEAPMVKARTDARGIRRNYQAEKYRKWELLKTLIENGMCPLTINELNNWRHYRRDVGRKYPQSEKFIQWLRFDFDGDGKPDFERLGYSKHESYYLFRNLIVDEIKREIFEKEPHIIGRVLYLLVQRRGYNDGSEIDEREKGELSETIKRGGGEAGALGSDEIEPYIEKHRTLGAALYYLQKDQKVRIRKRYNLRSRFEEELKEICRIQHIEDLYKLFWKAIIWQRPLRGQKGLVGVCTFEKNKRRCPVSHPLYEEYRTWVFINNLKIEAIKAEDSSREKTQVILNTIVYPEFYKAATDFKLQVLRKKLEKVGFTITAKFPDDTKVNTVPFLYRMKEIFGEDWQAKLGWENIICNKAKRKNSYNLEDLWHIHFTKNTNKNTGESGNDFIRRFAKEKLDLNEETAIAFSKIRLQQGYATLSLNAIKKILPYLQKGFIYSEAVYLANLPKVLGSNEVSESDITHFSEEITKILKQEKIHKKYIQTVNELINDQLSADERFGMDASYQLAESDHNDIENKLISVFGNTSWIKLTEHEKQEARTFVSQKYLSFLQKRIYSKNVFEKQERIHDKIFNWVRETYGISEDRKKYLWHPSEQETYKDAIEKDGIKYLGSPEPISKGFKNPMALKTLHKLKRLVNYLIETKKIDEDTRIVIEIARELNDSNKRKAIEKWQRDREAQNIVYRKQIIEINKECKTSFDENDKNLIDKIRLWEEQNRLCLYTGKSIGLCDILDGSKYDYEHTIPASISFDNELKNLTIADKTYNQQIKGKKLPTECPNYDKEHGIYKPILDTLQVIFGRLITEEKIIKSKKIVIRKFKKIVDLEKTYQEWKDKTSDDKAIKDNIIIKRHYLKMELDYWRSKLQTFIITEYKSGWRNSQLRDTQTITKYALPFLKTVFKKVEVQKGNITSDFRKIFKIQPRLEKKERTKHSHHAIDAAVLTLIPPAAIRDKILEKYNEANKFNTNYHEPPRQWPGFKTSYILNIENEVIINYMPEFRTLTPTIKNVRKRGKIQYVKEKSISGKWQYKLDENGNKIPLIAKGDNIRGQLHKDSFFGAILRPKYDENNKAININGKFLHEKKPSYVKRVHLEVNTLQGFKLYKDDKNNIKFLAQFEGIIDPYVRKIVIDSVILRIKRNVPLKDVLLDPIMMLDKNGKEIHPIRRVRVFQGNMNPPEIKKVAETFLSKHTHKQYIYAENTDYVSVLRYKGNDENKNEIYHFKPFTALSLSKEKIFPKDERQDGTFFSFEWELKPGMKIILKKGSDENVLELPYTELAKRIYKINSVFPQANNTGKIYYYSIIHFHLNVISTEIKNPKASGKINYENPKDNPIVRLNLANSTFLIENKHFVINPDGQINWKTK